MIEDSGRTTDSSVSVLPEEIESRKGKIHEV